MEFPQQFEAAMAQSFAIAYRDGKDQPIAPATRARMTQEIDHWFARVPLPITWVGDDPYTTYAAMATDIERGVFRVHCPGLKTTSRVFGDRYRKFRAVHDYFGHYCAVNPFGVLGELSAYGIHAAQFPAECLPLIFNELVLVNAFKDHFGHYSPEDKLVIL